MGGDEPFGYRYFDDPRGYGYRGYYRACNGDGYVPWVAARDFCVDRKVATAIDLGCAKGFLVEELLSAGVDAVGYDVSEYALSFATGLPCRYHNISHGIPGQAEAVFALGVLLYIEERALDRVLRSARRATKRFLLVSGFYEGDEQDVPDPLRVITRPYDWWRDSIEHAGFDFVERGDAFDVFEPATGIR